MNVLGNGVALDCENLCGEIDDLTSKGVEITPDNLMISDRASLLLPWHRMLDELEEKRLANKKYGSTKQGIAPFYSDKYQKKTVMAGDLMHPEYLKAQLADLLELAELVYDGVAGVAAALKSHDDIIVFREQVDHAALALVAPVDAYNCTV